MVSAAPFLHKEWERVASPAALCRRQDRSLKFWCRGQPMRSDQPPSRRHEPRSSGKQGQSRKFDVFPRCGVKGQGIVLPPQFASTVAAARRSDQAYEGLHGRLARQRNPPAGRRTPWRKKTSNRDGEDWGCTFATPDERIIFFGRAVSAKRGSRPAPKRIQS